MRRIAVAVALTGTLLGCQGKAPPPPYPTRACGASVTVVFDAGTPSSIAVAGEWNGFSHSSDRLVFHGNVGRLDLQLSPRDYAYDLVWPDGGVTWDLSNPYTRWLDGVEHSRLTIPDCTLPLLVFEAFNATPGGTVDVWAHYEDGSGQAKVDPPTAELSLDGVAQPGAFNPSNGRFTFHQAGVVAGKHVVTIQASDRAGRAAQALYLPFWIEAKPFSWADAVLYFPMTDRFRNGDPSNDAPVPGIFAQANYEGGDFAGITQAIDEGYFDQLGINALWVSPVDENPDNGFLGNEGQLYTGYHGYWPQAPRSVQRRFGGRADLLALVAHAHAHGIRVLGDIVINHVHQNHPYWQQHQEDDWFNTSNMCVCGDPGCDWNARRIDCWFAPYLPDLNWRSSAMSDQVVSDILDLVKETNLDGLRLDAVKNVEDVATRTIAARMSDLGAATSLHYYLVGETFAGAAEQPLLAHYIGPHWLDGQLDFPMHWSFVAAFANAGGFDVLDRAVAANETYYLPGTLNSPFIGNQDLPRFISIAAGQIAQDPSAQAWTNPPPQVDADEPFLRAQFAFTFLLTQPGVPLIYYGDEVGLAGANDPDNRRPMLWGSALSARQQNLLGYVRALGAARKANDGLRRGARITLAAEKDFYLYERDDAAGEGAVVAFNRSATPRSVSTTLAGALAQASGTWQDVLGGAPASINNGELTAEVAAQSCAVYLP